MSDNSISSIDSLPPEQRAEAAIQVGQEVAAQTGVTIFSSLMEFAKEALFEDEEN
ncbi:MAG: hypothetical protein AAF366_04070 [Pseudomonadota bacterium]